MLHTNLGRALQAEAVVEAVAQAMRSPVTSTAIGMTPDADIAIVALAQLLCCIAGAKVFVSSQQCGGGVIDVGATASVKEVVVSRGELVEIGGAFILDVMRQAGCTLPK